ncbi:MAG TPA: DNA-processing protein DprA [Pyrinomonadaceae bacterium]|nr:DNA-processing protein DprA [Pyrinomonadaceae bacterium]
MAPKNTIAIVGSRDVDRQTARTLFEQHLSSFVSGSRTWLLGGARGVDQWAIEWLLEQNETCWIVVPYTRAKQPRWAHEWLEQVDRVIELQLPKRKNAYAIRNRHIVDLSRIVIGFWSGKGGSTVKTLKHALRRQREVHGIPIFQPDDE